MEYTFWSKEKDTREQLYVSLGQKGVWEDVEKDFYMKEVKKLGKGKKSEKEKKTILGSDTSKKFRKFSSFQIVCCLGYLFIYTNNTDSHFL